MITYNPKEWFSQIMRFHKADTVRKLTPTMLLLAGLTFLIVLLDLHVLHLGPDHQVVKISLMYSLLGFVISLLLVFRTNTAYERWWEGRKLWGQLVNCSRNLSIKLNAIIDDDSEKKVLFQFLIHFPYALKNHLRNVVSMNEKELSELFQITDLKDKKHIPLQIMNELYKRIVGLNKTGKINNEQMLMLNLELQQYMEICGACERIRNSPIPFSYSTFLKKFIFIYVITLPIAYAPVLGYYSMVIVTFIFYVLASLEIIAEEIENPFGVDANDLPLEEISKTIRTSIELISKKS